MNGPDQQAIGQYRPPRDLEMTWLIARRAAVEALHDRLTVLMGFGLALVLPSALVLFAVRPLIAAGAAPRGAAPIGDMLAFYLLVVGLVPTISAVGIACGQFAGEKERGILTPLLASPASNVAIFGGKVLGAIIPPLIYASVADLVYVISLAVFLGPGTVALLPAWLSASMVVLVPAVACFGASVASLISSRVRTYNAAQQVSGLLLMPLWGVVLALGARLSDWGPVGMLVTLPALLLLDALLTVMAATTWRREDVLAHR